MKAIPRMQPGLETTVFERKGDKYRVYYGKTQEGNLRRRRYKETLRRIRCELLIENAKEIAKIQAKRKAKTYKRPSRAKRRPCESCGADTQRKYCSNCKVEARKEYDRAYAKKYRKEMLIRQAKYRAKLPKTVRFCVDCGTEVGLYKRYCDKCRKY